MLQIRGEIPEGSKTPGIPPRTFWRCGKGQNSRRGHWGVQSCAQIPELGRGRIGGFGVCSGKTGGIWEFWLKQPKSLSFTPKSQNFTTKSQNFTPKSQSFNPKSQISPQNPRVPTGAALGKPWDGAREKKTGKKGGKNGKKPNFPKFGMAPSGVSPWEFIPKISLEFPAGKSHGKLGEIRV